LNPGPWNFKEQMFSTITFNIAVRHHQPFNVFLAS
jgi:hypothetical protein